MVSISAYKIHIENFSQLIYETYVHLYIIMCIQFSNEMHNELALEIHVLD